jgi:hypothetical protein
VEDEATRDQLKGQSQTGGLRGPSLEKELAIEDSGMQVKDEVVTACADPGLQFKDEAVIAPAGLEPTEVRLEKNEVGDTKLPDETSSTWDLSDGTDSDGDWIPPNGGEPSERWEDQDFLEQRRKPRVKDEKPKYTIKDPPSDGNLTRRGAQGVHEDQSPPIGSRYSTCPRKKILAMIDNARRAQLIVMAQKSLNSLEFERSFAKSPLNIQLAP